jgi:hypothetical protein
MNNLSFVKKKKRYFSKNYGSGNKNIVFYAMKTLKKLEILQLHILSIKNVEHT